MSDSYGLTQLDPNSFEHLVNLLALRVLGSGGTGFGPGSDGGRDGYFEGKAPYPSEVERWSGCWYIQAKFHKPHLSKDPQKWLIGQIKDEIGAFRQSETKRRWPDNWIIATNIDPSGTPETGAFDQAKELVGKAYPGLKNHFHIWGGRKILDLLALHPEISEYYSHFLTPGKVLTEIYSQIKDAQAEVKTILRFLISSQFEDQHYSKLEQAGSTGSTTERPGIHDLFIDLPFRANEYDFQGLVMKSLVHTAAKCHRCNEEEPNTEEWKLWQQHPSRARVWFIKGGPGQGKSTIGQYFCQIQRAALILQKDQFIRFSNKQRDLAQKIQKVAEKQEFWTAKPRIPISIELKEFAQWFGQRDKNTPRGILTYLVEDLISPGVEEKVHVGTLKRMLANHSWVVVFDGLDEVPYDVKDSVALEVCRFVNEIALEVNVDLLTICTSRPQGYSGQFSDLDGPTVELAKLSPEQALACAKPVLELDRTANEAKKFFQTLKSAIESPAVRELMTTPLQSHIMAVVVRDGEKPPERRWKLFNNFYQVIKKRESNRNLPDKRLARLLSNQDKLLKAVHNRLGFVLHAEAESSKGAQTRLERSEFEKLVTDAVSQMVETEIDETIDVLLKATTDRLVLVSTPDDGNHVRFDIRPLQEFFAAEFLYDLADAEELRERMELIAGDAHWREVLHFLLSALIENNRRTEMAVAVEVLESLNEGDDNFRLLKRRLGRGAVLTARLLQEGVLEEDKRIRQPFQKCLLPLASSTEIELLKPLMWVGQPDSQSWLYSFLISCLQDQNLTESIGSAIVLSYVLPDDSKKVEEVSNFLLSSNSDYLSRVITSNPIRRDLLLGKQSILPKEWFLNVLLKLILGSQWISLTEEAFMTTLDIVSFNREKSYNLAKEIDLTEPQLKLFNIFLRQTGRASRSRHRIIKDYGFVEIVLVEFEYITEVTKLKLLDEDFSFPGLLQAFYSVILFIKKRSRSTLVEVLEMFGNGNISLLSTFVSRLGIDLPIDSDAPIAVQIEKVNSMSQTELEEWLPNQEIRITDRYRRGHELSLDIWREIIDDYPYLAVHLWGEGILARKRENDKAILSIIAEKVLQAPELLERCASLWGILLQELPEREADLRNAFLQIPSEPLKEQMPFFRFQAFKLNLPSEAPLLPYLVNALMISRRSHYNESEDDKALELFSRSVSEMINSPLHLKEIFNDLSQTKSIRSAAIISYLLHPDGSKNLEDVKQFLVDLYRPKVEPWYVQAVVICLSLLTTEEDARARWIVNSLLDAARADYEARQHLNRILTLWRESSYAPVQKADVKEKWLAGTD